MKCGDLMKIELEWVAGTSSVRDAARLMRDRSIGFLLVSDPAPDHQVGVVTDRDLAIRVCAEGLDTASTPIGRVATTGIVSCGENEDLDDVEKRMGDTQKSRIVVTNAEGDIVGVLSLADILRGDNVRRAVRTANAVSSREGNGPHEPIEGIHLTPSTPEDEERAMNGPHIAIGGTHGGSMKEFPT